MLILILSIPLQVVAFAFTLLASISSPVVDKLAIASNDGNNIGIFGYCTKSKCSPTVLHNNFSNIISSKILSDKTLDTLSPYLILCPIATGITFISLIFAIVTICSYNRRNLSIFYWIFSVAASVFAFFDIYSCMHYCVFNVLPSRYMASLVFDSICCFEFSKFDTQSNFNETTPFTFRSFL